MSKDSRYTRMHRRMIIPIFMAALMIVPATMLLSYQASAATWTTPVSLSSNPGYLSIQGDLEKGLNYYYAFDWLYSNGPVRLMRSTDAAIWSSPVDVFGGGIYASNPGMYVYSSDGRDNIIVASLSQYENSTIVAKSSDNGTSFVRLTNISLPMVYTSIAMNATWFEGSVDSIIYVVGTARVGGTGVSISFAKSMDDGNTWSTPINVTNQPGYYTRLMRYGDSLYCFYQLKADRDIYVQTSSDWGNTWGGPQLVYTKVNFAAFPCALQRLDRDKCVMTISDVCAVNGDPAARGVYGYFWLNNKTFQSLGYLDGPSYLTVDKFDGLLVSDGTMTTFYAVYSKYVNASQIDLVITHTTNSGLRFSNPPAALFSVKSFCRDPRIGCPYSNFEVNASASLDLNWPSTALQVRWDWDNDGTYDTNWSTAKVAHHQYLAYGNFTIRMELKNPDNILNTTTRTVSVITDNDGMNDEWEIANGLDPTNSSDAATDSDNDGLLNVQEYLNGTDPWMADTDGDGLSDSFEIIFSKTNATKADTDGNGVSDGLQFIAEGGYSAVVNTLPNNWIRMTITWESYTIVVETNSSVLSASFDKNTKSLAITVKGPTGTIGALRIVIPKSMVQASSNISLFIDNKPIQFTLNQSGGYYTINATYTHSTHEIEADFAYSAEVPPGSTPSDMLLIIALIGVVAAAVVIVLLVLTKSKKKT